MQRKRFVTPMMSPEASMRASAYQQHPQELLWRRNMLHGRENRAAWEAEYLHGRRHSYDDEMPPDFPIYQKFIYPGAYVRGPLPRGGVGVGVGVGGAYGSPESLNSLLHGVAMSDANDEIDIDEMDIAYATRIATAAAAAKAPEVPDSGAEKVVRNLTALGRFLEMLQRWPLPRLSLTTCCICFLLAIFIAPRSCAQTMLYPAFRLSFGTLYPAYASYKAVRTKNVKEYVKWMMYWIVYAFFTCTETFTDIFLSWFPFYYEVKVIIVLWLLSPATKGSSTLYRKFVHPMLTKREQEIDEYLNQAKERGYSAVLQLGSKGVNYATNVIMQTAIKGGGNLVQTIRRSYSLSDLSEPDVQRTQDEVDEVTSIRPQQRMLRPRLQTPVGRSASGTRHSTGMYFTEVDISGKSSGDFNYNIRSSDDISSGYSSAEAMISSGVGLSRTASMTNASKTRLKSKRTEYPRIYEDNDSSEMENMENVRSYDSMRSTPFYIVDDVAAKLIAAENEQRARAMATEADSTEQQVAIEKIAEETTAEVENENEPLEEQTNAEDFEEATSSIFMGEIKKEKNDIVVEKENTNVVEVKQETLLESVKAIKENEDDDGDDDDIFLDSLSNMSTEENAEIDTAPEENKSNVTVEGRAVVSARSLRETLKEIENNFRANIEVPAVQRSASASSVIKPFNDALAADDDKKDVTKRTAVHNKGKAPPPPPPPRPSTPAMSPLKTTTLLTAAQTELTVAGGISKSASLSSVCSTASTQSRSSGLRSLFKNLNDNIFRNNNSSNKQNDVVDDKTKSLLETEI